MQGYNDVSSKLYSMYQDKPYQDFFLNKLFQILSLASRALFRLNDSSYNTDGYRDLNNRVGAFCALGYGTKKNMKNAWTYFTKEYSDFSHAFKIQDILSFRYGFTLDEKLDILKSFAEDQLFLRQSNAQCLYDLGMVFFNGLLQKQHDNASVHNRDNGDLPQNTAMEKDYKIAFMCLQRAAGKNHPEALFQLRIMYHCGYGIAQNIEQGERCFKMMSDISLDYVGSIAMLYHTHNGLQNFEKALEWYWLTEERLSEDLTYSVRKKINEQMQTGLGLLYEFGDGVDQDYHKALVYYRNLANDSVAVGAHRLGLMYYYGKGTLVDFQRAFDLFGKSIQEASSWSGELPSVYNDTGLFTDGSQGTLVYRLINASEVIGESYYYLGLMYKNGQGSPQNEEMAQSYFIKALNHGCKRAGYEVVIR